MSGIKWPSEKVSPNDLLLKAREAANLAYAPYSKFHVGAALLFENDEIILSCNVENSSYGATICAERSGIVQMVSKGMRDPLAIAVAGSSENKNDYLKIKCPPCGVCRQTLVEFNKNILVVMASPEGAKIYEIKELLPHSFELELEE